MHENVLDLLDTGHAPRIPQNGEVFRDGWKRQSRRIDSKMIKNNVTDRKLNVEAIIKNINTISLELKKLNELSQLLLCDLTLHFSHPVKTDDLKETERNNPHFEESKVPDVSLASDSFLI
ncbi:hypothetical protein AB1E18_015063 [Capra hircus]